MNIFMQFSQNLISNEENKIQQSSDLQARAAAGQPAVQSANQKQVSTLHILPDYNMNFKKIRNKNIFIRTIDTFHKHKTCTVEELNTVTVPAETHCCYTLTHYAPTTTTLLWVAQTAAALWRDSGGSPGAAAIVARLRKHTHVHVTQHKQASAHRALFTTTALEPHQHWRNACAHQGTGKLPTHHILLVTANFSILPFYKPTFLFLVWFVE